MRLQLLPVLASLAFSAALRAVEAPTIPVHHLAKAPAIDGSAGEWQQIPAVSVPLRKTVAVAMTDTPHVLLRAGIHAERVYFLLQWPDTTESRLHKPWVWNQSRRRYGPGAQREDRLAMQFAKSGDYNVDWLSGRSFEADMWHWKASRSDPLGLAHDKLTIVSDRPLLRASTMHSHDGRTLYIQRQPDEGNKLYTTKRYGARQLDLMPKYVINPSVTGSVADISAKGVWRDKQWTLELSRLLDTGHDDDVAFVRGTSVVGGIAIFNQSENHDHAISTNLRFQF